MSKLINFTEVNPISNKQNLIIKNQIFSTIKKKDFILGKSVNEFEKKLNINDIGLEISTVVENT